MIVRPFPLWVALASCFLVLTSGAVELVSVPVSEKAVEKSMEGSSEQMPAIVVTASRFEEDPFMVPYVTDIVTQEQMRERSDRTIPEALELTPGVMIQKTAYGHGSPYVRGFTGRQNLLLVDGIRRNNSTWRSGPAQYWNTIDALSVERMELVKGQGAVLYGSDSIGGTLNVISQSSSPELHEEGRSYSNGSAFYRYSTNGNGRVGRLESNVGVGGLFGVHLGLSDKSFGDIRNRDGKMKHTGYDEYDYDLRADWMINKKNTLVLASRALKQDDVWRTHKTVYSGSWHGTSPGTSDDFHYDQRDMLHYVKLAGRELGGAIDAYDLTFSFAHNRENEFESKKKKDTVSLTTVDTFGAALQLESGFPVGKLVYGVDYYYDRVASRRTSGGKEAVPALPDGSTYDLFGAFAEYVVPLDEERWELRGGGRYTWAQADLGDSAEDGFSGVSRSWTNAVFGGRALYRVRPEWNVFFGVSQAFRAPNLDDLGANQKPAQTNTFVSGNPDLKSEKYLTFELGSHYKEREFSGGLTTYATQMRDLIVQRPVETSEGNTESVASNASDGWVMGVEAQGAWEVHPQWTWSAEGSWIYGKSDEFPDAMNPAFISRSYLSRLSPLMGSTGVRWAHPSRRVWMELRVFAADRADKLNSSDSRDSSRIPPGGTPGYYWASLYAGWDVRENVQLTFALENFTDQLYRVHGSGVNEPGIGFVSGVKVSW